MLVVIGIHEASKSYVQIGSKFRVGLRLNRRALLASAPGRFCVYLLTTELRFAQMRDEDGRRFSI
jgi:hypothetical protein